MMNKVKVNDGGGVWIGDDGEVMTTVWTCDGWRDLAGEYDVHDEVFDVGDDSLNLTIIFEDDKEIRFLNVNNADFDTIED